MDAYSIGYVIGGWLVDALTVLIVVSFLAIIGPTTFLMFCGFALLASMAMVARWF